MAYNLDPLSDDLCYRSFLTMLIRFAGYDIDFSEIDGDLLMIATIHSSNGVRDLLHEILNEAIQI